MSRGAKVRWIHLGVPCTSRTNSVYYVGYCPTSRHAHNNLKPSWKETTCPTCWAQRAIKDNLTVRELAQKMLEEGP